MAMVTEFKFVACGMTGVLLFLEVQLGKEEGMCDAEFMRNMMKTAACTTQLIKYSSLPLPVDEDTDNSGSDEDEDKQEEEDTLLQMAAKTYLGDAWFGSVPSVVSALMQGANLICVIKTGHAGYPKKFL